jgi:hypothetical protein
LHSASEAKMFRANVLLNLMSLSLQAEDM